MSECGEASATAKPVETAKKGKIKVSVRDVCTGKRVGDATIVVNGKSQQSSDVEDTVFDGLNACAATVKVKKHFKEADYKTFITHKPKITMSRKAKSSANDSVLVEEEKETKVRIDITAYRVVDSVRFCREHLRFKPRLNYGHWWIEAGDKSYGWWPKDGELGSKEMEEPHPPSPLSADATMAERIGHKAENASYQVKAARYAANNSEAGNLIQGVGKTFWGVPGILNGDEDHKRKERDPHHGFWKDGRTDEDYHPVIIDCRTDEEIWAAIRVFAFAYSGNWSWRLERGKNCHTFQKDAMKQLRLGKVKEI